ncbi:hypothetical protein EJ05DRAFT_499659 [Pseudovirgaria hyperparasitica]|uniref:Mid2 domain-containing protein n=1 Tax=Pseudovirgaria hyperparasitica TaxID=470096 RepID=A0A6A6W9A3_9PEZI|nr:uncharacterized protein EJ05DRAFT_499659 [Pseudovirgaria hyperparasitica]KAF2759243.1 hypothetical protein EJ05DRAFT_499659 [Pseudovirgaria hyperparasitica]
MTKPSWICVMLFTTLISAQQCYYPDGTAITDPDLNVSCGRANEASACCGARDECYTNGLCKGNGDGWLNWFWRYGCTDRDWNAKTCGHFCTQFDRSGRSLVLQCSQTEFCCAYPDTVFLNVESNYTCCHDEERVFDAGKPVHLSGPSVYVDGVYSEFEKSDGATTTAPTSRVFSTFTSTIASATLTPVTLISSSPTLFSSMPVPSASPSTSSSPNRLAIGIGAGLGIPLGITLTAGLAFLIWRYKNRTKPQGPPCPPMYQEWLHQHGYKQTDPHGPYFAPTEPQEIHGAQFYELPLSGAEAMTMQQGPQELADVSRTKT